MRPSFLTALPAASGRCGKAALRFLLKILILLLRGILKLTAQICRLIAVLIGQGIAVLRRFFADRSDSVRAAQHTYRAAVCSGSSGAAAFLRAAGTLLFGRGGILRVLFRYAVPTTCCLILWAAVSRGLHQQYGVSVAVNGHALGMVSAESDYLEAAEIVRKRLSYTGGEVAVPLKHALQLERCEGNMQWLTPETLADQILQNADVSLFNGWGVYVNDEFVGAVDDTHPIEAALTRELSYFSDRFGGELDDVFFADSVTYQKGSYLTESQVPAQELANRLTAAEHTVRTYTAGADETVYSVALRFSVTPDEIRRLNPEIPDVLPAGKKLTVPIIKRRLPIVSTKTVEETAFLDYETKIVETTELRQGEEDVLRRGVKGEKQQTVQIIYTNGEETGRKVLKSVLKKRPVDKEIGIGTFTAQPYSYDTVIDGNGRFAWPVDGGKITSLFGGERDHGGLDIGAAEYSEIYAGDGGTVELSTWDDSYGYFVLIDHGNGWETLYAHCVELIAQPGQKVRRGQPIALIGTTGDSTGPHLHFEVRLNGVRQNPSMYLRVNAD